jgi:hypothetical protein
MAAASGRIHEDEYMTIAQTIFAAFTQCQTKSCLSSHNAFVVESTLDHTRQHRHQLYPHVSVRTEDRTAYIHALQKAQAGQGIESLDNLLYERLDSTLGEYLSTLTKSTWAPTP